MLNFLSQGNDWHEKNHQEFPLLLQLILINKCIFPQQPSHTAQGPNEKIPGISLGRPLLRDT